MKQTKSRTTNNRNEKLEVIMSMLEQGVRDVFSSEQYQQYLSQVSKFHDYSFRNVLLIMTQKPDATFVCGLKSWNNNFDRYVKSGEKAIRILAPIIKKANDVTPGNSLNTKSSSDDRVVCGFRVVSVFDYGQTDGKPFELIAPELKGYLEKAPELEKAICAISDCDISFADIKNSINGYYDLVNHCIVIRKDMTPAQTIKTMIHELAHSRLHRIKDKSQDQSKDRYTIEVEAESVAYVVLKHLGFDTSAYSFSYIAGWSKDQSLQELSSSLSLIQKEADSIITLLTDNLK